MPTAMEKMLARVGKTRADLDALNSHFVQENTEVKSSPKPSTAARLQQVNTDDLSEDQRDVYESVFSWLNSSALVEGQSDSRLLTLGGYAGTGKTTLVAALAKEYDGDVAFCAYTGKAAGVLRKKLTSLGVTPKFCGTIHSLMYAPVENPETGEVSFKKRDKLTMTEDEEGPPFDLIVLDEASMVPDHVLEDLQAFNVPILAVGDHGQLPPVRGFSSLMIRPHLRLEKIHRQAENNPILRLSASVRETGKLLRSVEDGEQVRYVKREAAEEEIKRLFATATETTVLDRTALVYTNADRCAFNAIARQAYLKQEVAKDPVRGDLVICLKNMDIMFGSLKNRLYNGTRGFVRSNPTVHYQHKLKADFEFPDFSKATLPLEVSRYQFGHANTFSAFQDLTPYGLTPTHWWEVGALFDFGYALTVHKSQGSQFSDVLFLYDRGGQDSVSWKRFAYTAITRAAERLTIIV